MGINNKIGREERETNEAKVKKDKSIPAGAQLCGRQGKIAFRRDRVDSDRSRETASR